LSAGAARIEVSASPSDGGREDVCLQGSLRDADFGWADPALKCGAISLRSPGDSFCGLPERSYGG